MNKLVLPACIALSLAAPALSQKGVELPQAPKEMARLNFTTGNWFGIANRDFGQGSMERLVCSMSSVRSMGGRYIRMNFDMKVASGPYECLCLLSFDPQTKKYKAWWFDTLNSLNIEFTGGFESNALFLTSQPYRIGNTEVIYRMRWADKAEEGVALAIDRRVSNKWYPLFDGSYKKTGRGGKGGG